jgi:hypothetical protein
MQSSCCLVEVVRAAERVPVAVPGSGSIVGCIDGRKPYSTSQERVSDSPLCFRIETLEILVDDLSEDRLIGIGACKQCHRGAQFDRVNAAEYVLRAQASMRSDDLSAFQQPRSEHRMCKVGPCLWQIADRVCLRCSAAPKPSDLREDEPHPMTGLASLTQFRDRSLVRATAVLRSDETLQVHGPDGSARRGAG